MLDRLVPNRHQSSEREPVLPSSSSARCGKTAVRSRPGDHRLARAPSHACPLLDDLTGRPPLADARASEDAAARSVTIGACSARFPALSGGLPSRAAARRRRPRILWLAQQSPAAFARRCASSSRRRTLRRHGAAHGERSGRIPCASLSSAGNLPRRYGARDLASSFAQWVLAATLRPRLLHGARYPGLPEHEGKAAATDAHAMRLGYLGRVPPVFLDDTHPVAAVIAARLAARTIHRASWAQIARSADTRGLRRHRAEAGAPLGGRARDRPADHSSGQTKSQGRARPGLARHPP